VRITRRLIPTFLFPNRRGVVAVVLEVAHRAKPEGARVKKLPEARLLPPWLPHRRRLFLWVTFKTPSLESIPNAFMKSSNRSWTCPRYFSHNFYLSFVLTRTAYSPLSCVPTVSLRVRPLVNSAGGREIAQTARLVIVLSALSTSSLRSALRRMNSWLQPCQATDLVSNPVLYPVPSCLNSSLFSFLDFSRALAETERQLQVYTTQAALMMKLRESLMQSVDRAARIAEEAFDLQDHSFPKFTADTVFDAVSSLVAVADAPSFRQKLEELGHLNSTFSSRILAETLAPERPGSAMDVSRPLSPPAAFSKATHAGSMTPPAPPLSKQAGKKFVPGAIASSKSLPLPYRPAAPFFQEQAPFMVPLAFPIASSSAPTPADLPRVPALPLQTQASSSSLRPPSGTQSRDEGSDPLSQHRRKSLMKRKKARG
jgi:uncharacterized protein YozE (UPF0346 family)